MSLVAKIDSDLTTAMKEGNSDRVAVLRLLKSSLKNEQIKLGHELTDDEALKLLAKEAKQRKDSISAYEAAGRDELAADEQAELAVIESYLPEQMDEAAITKIVQEVIESTGATSKAQMGQVMGQVMAKTRGQADGTVVSRIVSGLLS